METMLIELTNQKAAGLLHELEELHIIKVLDKKNKSKLKLAESFAGKLPTGVANEMQKYVAKSRNEWSRKVI